MIELASRPMTWVATGDSITQAILHTGGSRGWVEHFSERIRWQLDRRTDIVINTGVAGWTAPNVLAHYDYLIGRFAPDVLSLSLGTNDALDGLDGLTDFHHSMRAIIALSTGIQIVVQTPVLASESGQALRPDLPAYCEAVRKIAAETGVLLVDHETHWLASFSRESLIPLLSDGAHPNAIGHLYMANHTLSTLGLGELTTHQRSVTYSGSHARVTEGTA